MVAAACLNSSLRWFSIFSTFASSSVLMYSVSEGANWVCVGWMGPSGCPEAAQGLQLPLGSSQDREHWALRRAELRAGTGYIPIQSATAGVVEGGIDTCPQD